MAAKVDGEGSTSTRPIDHDAAVAIVTADTHDGREVLRHSTAHVMAQAVTDLFPGAKYAIGPAIDDGFYYDFDAPDGQHFTDDDLERIEARMREIVQADEPFEREEVDRDDGARALRRPAVQARDHRTGRPRRPGEVGEGPVISLYKQPASRRRRVRRPVPRPARAEHEAARRVQAHEGRRRVLARATRSADAAAHLRHRVGVEGGARRLTSTGSKRPRRRDHRKLGLELDLFSFPEEIGSGLAVWHPKGGARPQDHGGLLRASVTRRPTTSS